VLDTQRLSSTKQLTIYFSAGVISLVAWLLNVSHLYWMAGALFLLPVASKWLGRLEHWGLRLVRHLPPSAHQGDTVTVRIEAENLLSIPKLHLALLDVLPPNVARRPPEPLPLHLLPHERDEVTYPLELRRRGLHTFAQAQVLSADLLSLTTVESRLPVVSSILVYPRIVPLPPELLPRDLLGGSDPVAASQKRGEGTSFSGIRDYRPGDPLRHVHWRSAARLGRLAVIEWEAEESGAALLAVETGSGIDHNWGEGTALDVAAGLAASLASTMLPQGISVRLLAPGYTDRGTVAAGGPAGLPQLLEVLARAQATSPSGLSGAVADAVRELSPGTVVCWLTPAPDPGLIDASRLLIAARLRPAFYVLIGGDGSAERERQWKDLETALGSTGAQVLFLREHDEVAHRLLS
jgi:uncharacterized protein (DUF58 family)